MITVKIESPGLPSGHDLTIEEDQLFEMIKQADLGKQLSLFLQVRKHLLSIDNTILKILMKNENIDI